PLPPTSTRFPYTTLFRSDTERRSPGADDPGAGTGPGRVLPEAARHAERGRGGHGGGRPCRGPAPRCGLLLPAHGRAPRLAPHGPDRKSTRLNSSHVKISY